MLKEIQERKNSLDQDLSPIRPSSSSKNNKKDSYKEKRRSSL